jgi:hypothetical protein
MRAGPNKAAQQITAIERARMIWKDTTAQVYRAAIKKDGVASSWLDDAGRRKNRTTKAPDQLARLVAEMWSLGFTLDQIDAALIGMTRGIARAATGTPPAA